MILGFETESLLTRPWDFLMRIYKKYENPTQLLKFCTTIRFLRAAAPPEDHLRTLRDCKHYHGRPTDEGCKQRPSTLRRRPFKAAKGHQPLTEWCRRTKGITCTALVQWSLVINCATFFTRIISVKMKLEEFKGFFLKKENFSGGQKFWFDAFSWNVVMVEWFAILQWKFLTCY